MPVIIPANGLLQALAAWQARSGAQPSSSPDPPPAAVGSEGDTAAVGPASSRAAFARLVARSSHRAPPWEATPQPGQPAHHPGLGSRPSAAQSSARVGAAPAVAVRGGAAAPALEAAPAALRMQPRHEAASAPDPGGAHAERGDIPGVTRQAARGVERAVAEACQGVVAIVTRSGAWATGVAVAGGGRGGFIVTNAHLVSQRGRQQGRQQQAQPRGGGEGVQRVRVQIWRRQAPGCASAAAGPCAAWQRQRPEWCSATVFYVFQGPLDLAVLQLEDRGALHGVRALRLGPRGAAAVSAGEPVAVVGFPLLSPCRCFGLFATAGIVTKVSDLLSRPCDTTIADVSPTELVHLPGVSVFRWSLLTNMSGRARASRLQC